jgi:hypothetical protein
VEIWGISVCVSYSDFLCHTIENNKKVLHKWIVVSDLKDHKTKAICDFYDIDCIQTDIFYEGSNVFNKYAGLNLGLKKVPKDAWVLFLDSDIVMLPETKRILKSLNLEKDTLYGMDRLNCPGIKRWREYLNTPGMMKDNWLLHTAGLELGARLVHHYGHEGESGRFEGYRPLGYWQLCHKNYFEEYPQTSRGADHCDLVFARQWPRHRRQLIPELFVIHLESPHGANWHKGVNWYGRKSVPFDIELHEEKIHIKEDLKNHTIEIDITETDVEIKGCPEKPTY